MPIWKTNRSKIYSKEVKKKGHRRRGDKELHSTWSREVRRNRSCGRRWVTGRSNSRRSRRRRRSSSSSNSSSSSINRRESRASSRRIHLRMENRTVSEVPYRGG